MSIKEESSLRRVSPKRQADRFPGFSCNPGCSTRQISGGRSAIGSQTLVPDLICYDYDSYGNIKKYRTEANR